MHVVLISQYFPPETGGPPNRLFSIAAELKRQGHKVTVIAEKPNHPEGVIWEEYRGGPFVHTTYEGIPVIYTWVFARPTKTFASRILFYLSFMVMAIAAARRVQESVDIVVASSPPLFVGLSGWAAAKLKRAKFVFDVRDIWPSVAVAMGELNNPIAASAARSVEQFIYRSADGVSAVTDSFCTHIAESGGDGTPMTRVMNGTEPEVFDREVERDETRKQLDVEHKFVVTYAGNLGLAQGLPHVLDAADHLRDQSDIVFHFRGSGPLRDELVAEASRRELQNVCFFDRVPLDEAAAHMAASDALLVSLDRHEIYQQFIPSKLFDSMATGLPVLLCVDGEARHILNEANAGLYYEAADGKALADAIQWLCEHPEEATAFGKNGRQYARAHCSRAAQARKLIDFLDDIVNDAALAQESYS